MTDTQYADVKEMELEELNFKNELIPLAAELGVKNASKIGKKKTIKEIKKILESGQTSLPGSNAGETAEGLGEPSVSGDNETPAGPGGTPPEFPCHIEVNEDMDMIFLVDGNGKQFNSIRLNGVRGRGRSRMIGIAKETAEGLGYRVQKVVYR